MALIHAVFAIHLRADQIVTGTAINFLALGITGYLFIDIYGDNGTPSNDQHGAQHPHPRRSRRCPGIGEVFGDLNLMIWIVVRPARADPGDPVPHPDRPAHPLGRRAPAGRRHRRHPGVPRALRAVILSGVLAALGGAYLSIGFVGSFDQDMTAGRGFIALAAVIFGKWRPYGAFGACLLFGFASGLADRLQSVAGVSVEPALDAPLRPHADRPGRPGRPLAAAGGRRPAVRQGVSAPRIVDLIARKRDGGELSADEIRAMIAPEVPDYQLSAFLMAVMFAGMTDAETTALLEAMVDSGARIDLDRRRKAGRRQALDRRRRRQDDAGRRSAGRGVWPAGGQALRPRPRAHRRDARQARVDPRLPGGALMPELVEQVKHCGVAVVARRQRRGRRRARRCCRRRCRR